MNNIDKPVTSVENKVTDVKDVSSKELATKIGYRSGTRKNKSGLNIGNAKN